MEALLEKLARGDYLALRRGDGAHAMTQRTRLEIRIGLPQAAYVNFVAVGDVLPDMPLFLKPELYVDAPLEATYETTWGVFPAPMKRLLEGPPAA